MTMITLFETGIFMWVEKSFYGYCSQTDRNYKTHRITTQTSQMPSTIAAAPQPMLSIIARGWCGRLFVMLVLKAAKSSTLAMPC